MLFVIHTFVSLNILHFLCEIRVDHPVCRWVPSAEQGGKRVEGGSGRPTGCAAEAAGRHCLGDVLGDPGADHGGGGEVRDGGRVAEGDLDLLGDGAGDHGVLDYRLARQQLEERVQSIQFSFHTK